MLEFIEKTEAKWSEVSHARFAILSDPGKQRLKCWQINRYIPTAIHGFDRPDL